MKSEFFNKNRDAGFFIYTQPELEELYKFIDTNHNGVISKKEFKFHFFDREFLEMEADVVKSDVDEELKALFRRIDQNNTNYVNCDEVVKCFNILGFPSTPEMLEVEFREYDYDRDNRMDFKEFRRFMHSKIRGTVFKMDTMVDEVKRKFKKIHPTDGQSYEFVQFATGLAALAPDLTPEEAQAVFFELNQDQAGAVDLDDFIAYLKKPPTDRESPLVTNALFKIRKTQVLPLKELANIYGDVPRSFCTAFTRVNFMELKSLPSESLYPKLMPNTLAYFDLFGEFNNQKLGIVFPVKPQEVQYTRQIKIDLATGVPIPEAGKVPRKEQIKARELRAVLLDRETHKFVGGTIIMPATWSESYEDRWTFPNAENDCTFWVRAPTAKNPLTLVFEFVLFISHKGIDLQMSCGWCSIDLENLSRSGTFELPLNGGVPSISSQILTSDVRTGRTTFFGKLGKALGGNIKSELKIQVSMGDRLPPQLKIDLDLLPKTILVPTFAVKLWRAYRCYEARLAYSSGNVNPNIGSDLIIRAFLRCVNIPTFHQRLCKEWNNYGE